jgi:putative Mn2+ efflux pump MntP
MTFIEIIFISLGLAADAFAVSLGAGASHFKISGRAAFRLSFHFGLFQFFMPIIGWYMGYLIEPYVKIFDHWIAFILLGYVGLKMILSAYGNKSETFSKNPTKGITLVLLSVATSIDAFAVGFSLAMLMIKVWYPSAVIGFVTLITSYVGIKLGNKLGEKFGRKMEIAGGIILILIGLNICISHLSH